MTGDLAHPESATRPPPRVIHVPPPKPHAYGPVLILVTAIIAMPPAVVAWSLGPEFLRLAIVWPCLTCLATAVLIFFERRLARARERQRAEWFRRHSEESRDPICIAIGRDWRWWSAPPTVQQIRQHLVTNRRRVVRCAYVVCLGVFDVPEAGAYRFEPRIITATEQMWRRLIWMPIGLLIVAWAIYLQLTGSSWHVALRFGGWLFGSAITVTAFWLIDAFLFPKYYRLAPGLIQVVRFRPWQRAPKVVSFPMTPGTTIRVTMAGRKTFGFSFKTGNRLHHIGLSKTRHHEQVADQIWQALLSTAPTPPLSDTDLVG